MSRFEWLPVFRDDVRVPFEWAGKLWPVPVVLSALLLGDAASWVYLAFTALLAAAWLVRRWAQSRGWLPVLVTMVNVVAMACLPGLFGTVVSQHAANQRVAAARGAEIESIHSALRSWIPFNVEYDVEDPQAPWGVLNSWADQHPEVMSRQYVAILRKQARDMRSARGKPPTDAELYALEMRHIRQALLFRMEALQTLQAAEPHLPIMRQWHPQPLFHPACPEQRYSPGRPPCSLRSAQRDPP
jgi:hypothetical protein